MIDARYVLRIVLSGLAAITSFGCVLLIGVFIIRRDRPTEALFNVEASTERLDLNIASVMPFRWTLQNAEITEGRGMPMSFVTLNPSFTGSLSINPPAIIQIERVAYGPLTIDLENPKGGSVGVLYKPDDELERRLDRVLQIVIRDLPGRALKGERVVFALGGSVRTGRPTGGETNATSVLRAGTVTLLAPPLWFGEPFQANREELLAGDYFSILAEEGGRERDATGFVVADERPAMLAVYSITGRKGQITRPGGGLRPVSVPLIATLIHDSLIQGLISIMVFAAAVAGFVAALMQIWEARRTRWSAERP